eukprot:798671-Alexandrium_andersonii.AAC.1
MEWPAQMAQSRAVFMGKTAEISTDPMDVRILNVFPVAYRKWAKLRMKQMDPWIAQWALPEMFAGVPGKSADAGAWMLA